VELFWAPHVIFSFPRGMGVMACRTGQPNIADLGENAWHWHQA
jgi:hypothetical protein